MSECKWDHYSMLQMFELKEKYRVEAADLRAQLEAAERKLHEEQEEHAKLQSRCYEWFPSATDGIFTALKVAEKDRDNLQAQVVVLRGALERIANNHKGTVWKQDSNPESETYEEYVVFDRYEYLGDGAIAYQALSTTPEQAGDKVRGLVEALEHIAAETTVFDGEIVPTVTAIMAIQALAKYRGGADK